MKYIIFFILTLISFLTACNTKEDDNCVPSEEKTIQCDTNEDCTEQYGSNYFCTYSGLIENESCESKFCFIDKCNSGNVKCGLGKCIPEVNNYICECDENSVLKLITYYEKICIENKCQSKEDCENIYKIDDYGNHIALDSCSSQGKCVNVCETDFDCIGKDEVCNKGYNYSDCYNYKYIDCGDYYNSPYSSMNSNYCEKKCDENNPCKPGFVCNNENQHCLPICFSDEDCLSDKFSEGEKCSLDLNYCVNNVK